MAAQYVPGMHGKASEAFCPGGQYTPPKHGLCVDELEPAGQKKPALHLPLGALNCVAPQNEPGVQTVGKDMPVELQKPPIVHGDTAELPDGQYVPNGQDATTPEPGQT